MVSHGDNADSLSLLGVRKAPLQPCIVESETETYLKFLSTEMTNVLNTKDFTSPIFQHVKSNINTNHDAGELSMKMNSKQRLIDNWSKMMADHPNYHTDIIDINCVVDESYGFGKVWILRTVKGLPDGLVRECVSEMSWEREKGDWYCSGYRGIRGFVWPGSEVCYEWTDGSGSTPDSLEQSGSSNG